VGPLRCGVQPFTQGYYYHPSRHSAGQPIVAGWSYQFIAQLGSCARAGPLPWMCGASDPPKTPTRSAPSR
jgi:hypothetical protein